jgi:hypothetical protein
MMPLYLLMRCWTATKTYFGVLPDVMSNLSSEALSEPFTDKADIRVYLHTRYMQYQLVAFISTQ